MSKPNLLDLLKGTLQEIQQNNAQNPNEETADPSIFDFIKDQLSEVDKKTKSNIQDNRGNNVGIFDLILDKITNAQKQNKENPNVRTAPGNIFEQLRNKVNQQKQQTQERQQRRAQDSINDIIHQYNLDVRNINRNTLQQIEQKYVQDNAALDHKYAQYLHNLNLQQRR